MPRVVIPDSFHPSLQFRYKVLSSKLPGAHFYARSAQQPSLETNPVTVEHINAYFKVKGKLRWNSITLSCYQFEGMTAQQLWDYINGSHQTVSSATDTYAPAYKHDMQILTLAPDGDTPVATWKLVGAFIESSNWGDMDWGTDDVIQCEITVAYDYAMLT
jgi:hypothetical protein